MGGKTFKSGDWISVNGNSGQVQWKGSERETKRESVPASEKEKEQGREKERKRRRERKREREGQVRTPNSHEFRNARECLLETGGVQWFGVRVPSGILWPPYRMRVLSSGRLLTSFFFFLFITRKPKVG